MGPYSSRGDDAREREHFDPARVVQEIIGSEREGESEAPGANAGRRSCRKWWEPIHVELWPTFQQGTGHGTVPPPQQPSRGHLGEKAQGVRVPRTIAAGSLDGSGSRAAAGAEAVCP